MLNYGFLIDSFGGEVKSLRNSMTTLSALLFPFASSIVTTYHICSTQQAFVLNLNQHWFTLRRFGQPGGTGHWYNLNSFFDTPERIGKMYLGMVLQQAEMEGRFSIPLS